MKKGTKKESNHLRNNFAYLITNYELQVYMTIKKHMNRFIPLSVEFFIGC